MAPLSATLLALSVLAVQAAPAPGAAAEPRAYERPEYLTIKKGLARGWGTWESEDPLAQVHLPDGLSVSLILRRMDTGDYLSKPTMVTDKKDAQFRAGAHALDGSYSEADVSWRGTRVRVQSATEGDDLVLLLTRLGDAGRPVEALVTAGMLWGRPGSVSRDAGGLTAALPAGAVRVFGTGREVDASGSATLDLEMKGKVGVSTGKPRTTGEIEAIIGARRKALQDEAALHGDLAEAYGAIQASIGWSTIYEPQYDRVITTVSREWNKWFGGYVIFGWDNFFIPYACSLFNRELTYANFAEHMRSLTPGGFIPNVDETGGRSSWDRSQPPVGSLMLKEIYKRYGDRWILEASFDDLLSWNRWWPRNRMNGKLLTWGSDLAGNPMNERDAHTKVAAAWESGMDDSPMYDDVPYDPGKGIFEMQDVGLNGLYVADCSALADIADVLGRRVEAAELRLRAEESSRAMEALWNPAAGLYLNQRTDTGLASPRPTPTMFYPLLGRVPAPDRATQMVDQHLMNPVEFGGEFVIPSIARNDPDYPRQHYWKGAVWPPLNFLVYLGLRNYDLPVARRELAKKSMGIFLGEWKRKGFISENYSAITGTGDDPRLTSTPFYAWCVLMGLMGFIEEGQMPAPEAPIAPQAAR
jgi:putative isomerase